VSVSRLDEFLEGIGATVVTLNGKDMGWIVTPGEATGKLHRGHDFDRVDAEISQVTELFNGTVQISRWAARLIVEGSNVHLVNDHLVPRWRVIVLQSPIEIGIVDD